MATARDLYDDMLDEVGIDLSAYSPARVLREVDPVAYDCGFADYLDSLDIECEDCGERIDTSDLDMEDAVPERCERCEREAMTPKQHAAETD